MTRGSGTSARGGRPPHSGLFRSEGDFWRIAWQGRVHLLEDAKGFGYLVHLLRHPGDEFHALDLVAGPAGGNRTDDAPRNAHADQGLGRLDEALAHGARPSRSPGAAA